MKRGSPELTRSPCNINGTPVDDPLYLCQPHEKVQDNVLASEMYEHVRGILRHNIRLILE